MDGESERERQTDRQTETETRSSATQVSSKSAMGLIPRARMMARWASPPGGPAAPPVPLPPSALRPPPLPGRSPERRPLPGRARPLLGGGDPDAIGGGRRRAGRWGGRGRLGPRGGSGRGGVRPPCALRPWARQRLAPRKEHCVHSPRVKKAVSHLRVGANHAARPWGLAATWAPVGRGRAELATPARARPGARAGARRGSPPSAVGICPTTGLREVA